MRRLVVATLVLLALLVAALPAAADEGWVITSFDATFVLRTDGVVEVTEDIRVDFRGLQRHGIIRDIPEQYTYEPDRQYRRKMPINVLGVDDGSRPHIFSVSREGANLSIKIGDPQRTVTGQQRYRIRYRVEGALNAFESQDEFFWNVTGHGWDVPMQRVTATVTAPSIARIACYEGRFGSRDACSSRMAPGGDAATFAATRAFASREGLTVVVALPKGAIEVGPPLLVRVPTLDEKIGLRPLPLTAAFIVGVAMLAALGRLYWSEGRDRWLGDVQYLTGDDEERTLPLRARETIVVEYQPPELGRSGRRLRPAEIGVLVGERADTLDVSATIVDLAVRGHLRILEEARRDYTLEQIETPADDLLPYEQRLLTALFSGRKSVSLDALKAKFYTDLAKVKADLYEQSVRANGFFASNPESVRMAYWILGSGVALGGAVAAVALLVVANAAIVAAPVVAGGALLVAFAGAMPRRTGAGRETYRRALGFREFMVTAETARQRFYEEEGIFDKYLPYAIVFRCTRKWAKAFEGLERVAGDHTWYVSSRPFVVNRFVLDVEGFSSSVSSAIESRPASAPAASGSSGFSSGGGFSGGGGGGGGGRSW